MKNEQDWTGEFPTPLTFSMVLYTDGGSNIDTLLSGWGIHGYIFPVKDEKAAKIKKAKGAFTNLGYVDGRLHISKGGVESTEENTTVSYRGKMDKMMVPRPEENDHIVPVTPTHYIDAYGGQYKTSNNSTELFSMFQALILLTDTKPVEATILADSKYVLEGLLINRRGWEDRGGKTSQNQPVKNWDLWKLLFQLFDELVAKNETKMFFAYVPGHAGDTGNEKADYNANRGMILQRDNPGQCVYLLSDKKGYVQNTKLSSRLLEQRWWYALNDRTHYTVDYDPRHVYFFGNHGNEDEDDMIGKSTATAKIAILFLKEKEPVLELLGDFLKQRFFDGTQIITKGYLENILDADRYASLLQDKHAVLWDDPEKLTIRSPDKRPLLEEMRPTYLGFRLLSRFENMLRLLEHGFKQTGKVMLTDITDLCVTTTQEGKKKPVTKPTVAIDPPNKTVKVPVLYELADGSAGKADVKLKLGQDIPLRNTINALGCPELKIHVITWPEGTRAFRYATLLEVDGDTLFTASLNSNIYELTGKL